MGHWSTLREDFVISWAIRARSSAYPNAVSFWHQTSLATLAVHHPTPTHPRLQSRSGTHADALLLLRDGAPRPSVLQPHLDTCQPRQRIPCNAAACTCNGAASLGASLCLCKNFNVELRPRSFLWLASPLLIRTDSFIYSRESIEGKSLFNSN